MAKKVKKPITDEIAVVTNDIYQGYIGRTLINPDKTLQSESGGKGVEIYEDLMRDPEIRQAMQTRRLAVTGREWNVIPATDDSRDMDIADFVEKVLLNCNFDQGRKALLSAIVVGFKAVEVMWDYSEGSVWINRLKGKASRRFTFDLDDNLRLLTLKNMIEGEEVPDRKFQLFSWGSDNDTPFGYGLGSSLYWLDWFSKNSLKFWMIFADKFGSPTAIGKYPTGTPKEQQYKLLRALEAIQQESAIKIPDTMEIDLLEAARSSTTDTYEKLSAYLDKKKTKLILGQTLTSDTGKSGSYAQSKTHNEVRQDIVKADADELCQALNDQLIKWIVDFNFPEIKKYPQCWIRTEDEKDLMPVAERDEILNTKIGLPMTKKYFYETYGIPEPEKGDELVETLTPLSSMCGCGGDHEFAMPPDEWVSNYIERITPMMRNVREAAMNDVENWLRTLSGPPTKEMFTSKIQGILGESYSALDQRTINNAVADMYKFYKLTDLLVPGLDVAFGGVDMRAVDFLGKIDNFYLSKSIKNPSMQKTINKELIELYHERGVGIFGRGSESAILEIKTLLSQKMIDLSEGQVQRIVDTAVQRTRNWAHTSQLYDGGIAEIEIVEPTQDCDFCEAINGSIVRVETAYRKMQSEIDMSPEQYEEQFKVKSNQPVLENLESFVDSGSLPPYHPHCHGRIIKRVV